MAEDSTIIQNTGAVSQQTVKSKRDIALERLKARHPDVDYPDDDAVFGAINDDYDADQEALSGYKDNEKALSDMLSADPRAAALLKSMKKGGNPWTELIRQFGDDAIDWLSDPEHADEVAAAQQEYLDNITKGNKLEEEYHENMQKSLAILDDLDKEFGEETTNELVGKLISVANDVIQGKITKEAIGMFRLAANHDKDVEDAAHEAEVRGRNANITKNLRLKKKGDGTADLDGAGAERQPNRAEPDLGALGGQRRSIWEVGNEKRTHMQ